jgi:hypothetical protein
MTDQYIDHHETLGYGAFAVEQINAVVLPLAPSYEAALTDIADRISAATSAMAVVLKATGQMDVVTYKKASGDPLAEARNVLRRAVKYAESRPAGARLAAALLNGQNLSTVLRRRPAKLLAALNYAIDTVEAHAKDLPEHAAWSTELTSARDALAALDKSVRASRIERRGMTPEVAKARSEWLKVYGAAKLIVEGVLKLHDRAALMPEVFDDLAEVHRVSGVVDDAEPAPAAAAAVN